MGESGEDRAYLLAKLATVQFIYGGMESALEMATVIDNEKGRQSFYGGLAEALNAAGEYKQAQ